MIRTSAPLGVLFVLAVGHPAIAQDSGDYFPGKRWMHYADPSEAGFELAKLREAEEFAESVGSSAFMVVYRGAVLVDWGQTTRRFRSHSSRKSLMSALYGAHVGLGTIDTTKTLAELGVDESINPLTDTEKTATVLDLLSGRSGIYLTAAYEPAANPKPERGAHRPGEHFCYNNWDFNALVTIFEQETGVRIFEEFKRCIADPIGMQDYESSHGYYHYDYEMSEHPAYPMRMSARDYARLGLLYLNDGRWGNRQIIPSSYVQLSGSKISDAEWNGGYGLMWWVHTEAPFGPLGMFSAYGNYCQAIDVIPGADLVIVNRVDSYTDDVIMMTWDDHRQLIKMVLDAKTGDPVAHPRLAELGEPPPEYASVPVKASEFHPYLGMYPAIYENPVRVFLDGDTPMINFGEGDVPLDCLGDGHFVVRDFHEHIYFGIGEDGEREMTSMWGLIIAAGEAIDQRDYERANEVLERMKRLYPECETGHRLRCKLRMREAKLAFQSAMHEYDTLAQRRPQIDSSTNPVEWELATLWASTNPFTPPESYLERFVGSYGVRHVTLEGGVLRYRKEGGTAYELRPLAWGLFAYERTDDLRFRFHSGEQGDVVRMDIIERDRMNGSYERDRG